MPKLTDAFLAKLTVEAGRKDRLVFDTACPGLGVRVTTAGTRTFLVQWSNSTDPKKQKRVREHLGVWGSITIDQARKAAQAKLGDVAKGSDPRAERLRQKQEAQRLRAESALTVDRLIDDWATLHLRDRSDRYKIEAARAVRLAFRDFLNRPAAQLTRADITTVLDAMQRSGKKAMAARTLSYARAAFQWTARRGQIPANPFIDLPSAPLSPSRDRVLSDFEVAVIWQATGQLPYPWGPFYRLALLTLQRREEVAGMRWSEIDIGRALWSIPASRMKNNKPHDIHLSRAALQVLEHIPKNGCDLVFTKTGRTPVSGFSKAKIQLDARIGEIIGAAHEKPDELQPWRLHDFRRTGVSALAKLGVDSIVADKLLAHQPAKLSGVAAVYQRHDFANERTAALDAWADCVLEISKAKTHPSCRIATIINTL